MGADLHIGGQHHTLLLVTWLISIIHIMVGRELSFAPCHFYTLSLTSTIYRTMVTVTVKSGRSSATQEYPEGTQLSVVLADTSLMAFLGAPENASAVNVDSDTLDSGYELQDGDVIYLERQASAKA